MSGSINDNIDIKELEKILKNFSEIFKLPICTIDIEGNSVSNI